MIVECGYCGAPLDVREGRRYTKCTYCEKTSEARNLRTIEAQTPPGWRPPPVWTPPQHVAANSAVPLRYHRSSKAAGLLVAIAIFISIGVAAIGATVAASGKKRPLSGFPGAESRLAPAALAKVSMKSTPERLQQITGVKMDAHHSMRVPLSHPSWDAVTFRWDPDNLDHVRDFYFNGSAQPDTTVRKKLKELLGRRFVKDGFQWEGCGLNVSTNGDHVSSHVSLSVAGSKEKEESNWKQQSDALWKVARHAVLGLGDEPDDALLRDVLGGGYPVADLAKLNVDADIDGADEAVRSVFKGAIRRLFIDLEYKIAIDHPWYGEASIDWKNKKAARVAEVSMRPPPGLSKWQNQKAVDACVEAELGKPFRVTEGDHLGGSRDTIWRPATGGEVRVYEHMLVITLRDSPFSKPMPRDTWTRVVNALHRCGRKAE